MQDSRPTSPLERLDEDPVSSTSRSSSPSLSDEPGLTFFQRLTNGLVATPASSSVTRVGLQTTALPEWTLRSRKGLDTPHDDLPGSESSLLRSSPAITQSARKRKRAKKIQLTWEKKRLAAIHEAQTTLSRRQGVMDRAITLLDNNNITLLEFLQHAFTRTTRKWRWESFFRRSRRVQQVLDLIADGNNSKDAKDTMLTWAKKRVNAIVSQEAEKLSRTGFLQVKLNEINQSLFTGFNLTRLSQITKDACPTILEIMRCMVTTKRQEKQEAAAEREAMLHNRPYMKSAHTQRKEFVS